MGETVANALTRGYDIAMNGTKETQMRPEALDLAKFGQMAAKPKPADLKAATVMEVKYDGHRIYAYRDVDRVRLFARSGNEKSQLLRTIPKILKRLPVGTWVDGELCAFKADGTTDWGTAQSVLGSDSYRPDLEPKMTYVVFDMMAYDGVDIRSAKLKDRREALENAFTKAGIFNSQAITLSPQFDNSTEAYDALVAAGHEGAIVKDPTSRYTSGGRGKGWYKMKASETADVVIMGATDGKGKYVGQIGAVVFGQYDAAGRLVEQGQCSGMTDAKRLEFTKMNAAGTLAGTVIEIAHMGAMPTGGLRHPQFKRVRDDKDPRTVTIADQAKSC